MSEVKVAVRVRPCAVSTAEFHPLYSHTKIEEQPVLQIDPHDSSGRTIKLFDPSSCSSSKSSEQSRAETVVTNGSSICCRTFRFDQCFWSAEMDDGELSVNQKNKTTFASQSIVFERIGKPNVDWALQGYNVSIFAYGQVNHDLLCN